MGTLKAKIQLESGDLNSGTLDAVYTKDLTVTKGGILLTEVDATEDGTAVILLAAADHASGTKVYIRNRHNTNDLNILFLTGGTPAQTEIQLKAGQWCFFPWTGGVDIRAWASAADTTVEYGTFA